MANPSVTYTFTNSTTADGTQVSQNFTDLINGMTDGTKSFSIDALTAAGAAIFNGNVTLGNAAGDLLTVNAAATFAAAVLFNGAVTLGDAAADDITVTGSLASAIPVKTNSSFDIGDSTHALRVCYANKLQGGTTAGVAIVGKTDGALSSAGNVGEVLKVQASGGTGANGAYFDMGSLALSTAGNYRVTLSSKILKGTGTFGSTDFIVGVSTTSGNSATGLAANVSQARLQGVVPTTFTEVSMPVVDLVVRFDGTTITRVDDATAYANGGTLYFKAYVSDFSNSPTYSMSAKAVRIA